MSTEFKIYVACLSSYNEGRRVGKWIDLDLHDEESLKEEVLETIKGEEWAIHDYEGPRGWNPTHETFSEMLEAVELFQEKEEELGEEALEMVLNMIPFDELEIVESARLYEDSESFLDDMGLLEGIPSQARTYIDFDRWMSDVVLSDGGFHDLGGDGVLEITYK